MVSIIALPPAVGRKTSVAGFWPSAGAGLIWIEVPVNAAMGLRSSLFACFLAESSAMARDAQSAKAKRMVVRVIIIGSFGTCDCHGVVHLEPKKASAECAAQPDLLVFASHG